MTIPAGWQIDIGLEIHAQLNTHSKLFSGASTLFGQSPNSQACAIDLGMPGVLPSVNAEVFKKAVQFGLSIGAMINQESRFDRKNYFYPDLPKGYQITQMDHPIVLGGEITIQTSNGTEKIIRVTRAHLEEDAGKSIHDFKPRYTGIDLNRAGTPLLEIVSAPDIKNAEEAVAYAKAIHQLLTYLEVCDGNMAEGSLRFDANISVRRLDAEALGTRSEIKNLNSFRFLEQAIHFETERQISGCLSDDQRSGAGNRRAPACIAVLGVEVYADQATETRWWASVLSPGRRCPAAEDPGTSLYGPLPAQGGPQTLSGIRTEGCIGRAGRRSAEFCRAERGSR